MYISDLINFGSKSLRKKLISSHQLDSELLLSNVLNKSRENILVSPEKNVSKDIILNFNKLLNRRLKKEPLAYILKKKEFWSKNFLVDRNTLIPRPETELLVEQLVKYFRDKKIFILDIGTGSGCILLSLLEEIKKSKGIGIDISNKALDVAYKNSKFFGFSARCKFYKRSLDRIYGYKFDLIVSNPPYIKTHQIKNLSEDIKRYEPRKALDGGNDGLDVIKKVIYKSRYILRKNGTFALEIGYGQYIKVSQILKLHCFIEKYLVRDYQKNIICIISVLKC